MLAHRRWPQPSRKPVPPPKTTVAGVPKQVVGTAGLFEPSVAHGSGRIWIA